jgi:hypothetical protein
VRNERRRLPPDVAMLPFDRFLECSAGTEVREATSVAFADLTSPYIAYMRYQQKELQFLVENSY